MYPKTSFDGHSDMPHPSTIDLDDVSTIAEADVPKVEETQKLNELFDAIESHVQPEVAAQFDRRRRYLRGAALELALSLATYELIVRLSEAGQCILGFGPWGSPKYVNCFSDQSRTVIDGDIIGYPSSQFNQDRHRFRTVDPPESTYHVLMPLMPVSASQGDEICQTVRRHTERAQNNERHFNVIGILPSRGVV
jgi:hypothetical protein